MPDDLTTARVPTAGSGAAVAAAATVALPNPDGLDPADTAPRIDHHLVPADGQWHEFDLSGPVLNVGGRASDVVEFWALTHPNGLKRYRMFRAFLTGEPLPQAHRYHGTVEHGTIVLHLFERLA